MKISATSVLAGMLLTGGLLAIPVPAQSAPVFCDSAPVRVTLGTVGKNNSAGGRSVDSFQVGRVVIGGVVMGEPGRTVSVQAPIRCLPVPSVYRRVPR